jgi:PAS domain S-box-containing protein
MLSLGESKRGPGIDRSCLEKSEKALADIVEFLPDATFVIDEEGRVIAWNKAMENMTGTRAKDMLGKTDREYALPFYRERRPMLIDLALHPDESFEKRYDSFQRDGDTITVEVYLPIFRPEGVYFWAKAAPIYDSYGKIVGAIQSIQDVTERKRAEQKVANIIEFFPDATLVIDADGKIIAWNKAMETLTGFSADQMLGKGDHEYSIPLYRERRPILIDLALNSNLNLEKFYSNVQRSKGTLAAESYLPHLKGGVYLFMTAAALYDSAGNVMGAIESMRDVTERKRAEQKVANIIEFFPDATLVVDTSGKIIAWNRALETLTGVLAGEMLGKGDYEYALPLYGKRRPILIDLALNPNEELEEVYPGLQKSGGTLSAESYLPHLKGGVYLFMTAAALYDSNGKVMGAIESMRDVTERKRAEQKVANIIEFLPDATLVIDKRRRVIAWNKAMEDLTGVRAEEMLGKGDYEYSIPIYGKRRPMLADLALDPDESFEKIYNVVSREGDTIKVEIFLPDFKPGGVYLWAKASPLYDCTGNLMGAIESIQDITGRKVAEQKLERSKAELSIAAEIQKSFIPRRTPAISEFKLAAVTIPAMEVGGDFYDFISLDDGKQGLVIADVAGKSIPAALFMALSRTIVRANAAHQPKIAEVLRDANNMIAADASAGMFVTLLYGVLDGKSRTLTYSNAGHPPPLIFRSGRCDLQEQGPTGIALGAIEGVDYEERQVQFSPGDVAVFYTDGVTEAEDINDKMYGLERLSNVVAGSCHLTAQEIMGRVLEDISNFSSGRDQFDDITLIIVKAESASKNACEKVFNASEEEASSATNFIEAVMNGEGFEMSRILKAQLAVEEVFLNIVQHGYEGKGGEIRIAVDPQDDRLVLTIEDEGAPFDPTKAKRPEATRPDLIDDLGQPQGGLGLHLMRSFMGEVSYEFRDRKNTQVFIIRRGDEEDEDVEQRI